MANCFAPVTTILPPQQFPQRVRAAGWNRPIFVRGGLVDGPAVAIVGARAASTRAMQTAYNIAKHLAKRGIQVISGGALGVDGAAHRGAIAGGGSTTVVVGTGCDIAYPDRHAELFRDVIRAGGALASLVPDGTPPRRYSFVRRNQLIAALVDIVIVIEADLRSGSLSTARAAIAYDRLVAARPGSPGCNRLLSEGATVVDNEADVDLALDRAARQNCQSGDDRDRAQSDASATHTNHAWTSPMRDGADATAIALVRDAVAQGACGIDAIVDRTQLSVPRVLRALARLP